MGAAQTKKKKLRILTKEINESMTLISNINQKIQNFISLLDLFEDEEQIDKIRTEIIDVYKFLCVSETKIKSAYGLLPQDDAEFADIYLNYDKELTNLSQSYERFIKEPLLGSGTLATICRTDDHGLHIYYLQKETSWSLKKWFQIGSSVIAIPNSRLFIYSPAYSGYDGISIILDLKLRMIKQIIPENLKCLYSGGAYYKKSVYLFGGVINDRACTEVRRFDLEKKLWYHVAPLPKASSMCACTVFMDAIYICGVTHQQIYKYDLNTASYSIINTVIMESFTPRVLFKANSRVYFFERVSGIFESDIENEYNYTRIGRSKLEWGSVSQVKYYNRCVYFISPGNKNFQIFKFDLSAKKLIKLQ